MAPFKRSFSAPKMDGSPRADEQAFPVEFPQCAADSFRDRRDAAGHHIDGMFTAVDDLFAILTDIQKQLRQP